MYTDDDNERELRGSSTDDWADYKSSDLTGSAPSRRQARPPVRPQARLRGTPRGAPSEPWTPAMQPRRGPSHPDWETPLTQYDYPQLRGQDNHRAIWPLAAAALAVTLVVVILVIIPTLLNRNSIAVATPTPKPSASASVDPNASNVPGASPSGIVIDTSQPTIYFAKQYTVKAGDRFSTIAKYFGLQQWELLQANPQITNPNLLKVGMVLNIPDPGQLTRATPSPASTPSPTPSPSPVAP